MPIRFERRFPTPRRGMPSITNEVGGNVRYHSAVLHDLTVEHHNLNTNGIDAEARTASATRASGDVSFENMNRVFMLRFDATAEKSIGGQDSVQTNSLGPCCGAAGR